MAKSDKEKTSIQGTLLMLDDATPHVAVPVQAIRDGEVISTVLSDERGEYQFVGLASGMCQVRCQILGGYVYYGEEKARSLEDMAMPDESISSSAHKPISLQIQQGETLRNIDFRFASFKKGTWRNYNCLDGLAGELTMAIHRTPDSVMWFGILGGVSRYDGKTFVNLTDRNGFAAGIVYAIHHDPDGVMWFGTSGGVSRYDGKAFVNLTMEDGLAHNNVWDICSDTGGVMWFGTSGGVSRYDGKAFVNLTMEDGLAHNNVYAIHRDPDDVMWFGTGGGVSRYDGKTFTDLTTRDGLVNNFVYAIHRDPDGVMWFGTFGGGVSRYDGKAFVNLTMEDGLAHNNVWAIHRDPDDVMWFGTSGGVSRYDRKTFTDLTTRDGLVNNNVSTIHRDPDGVMWFGTEGGGISRYDGKRFISLTTEDGLVNNSVMAIHRGMDGVMWFASGRWDTPDGISRYDGKEFVNLTTEDGLAHNCVIAIHHDPDGVMWFGTRTGVSRYDGEGFVNFTTRDGLTHNVVRAIHCNPDGIIWFATDGGGISRYDGKAFVNLAMEDGLAHNNVYAIHRDPDDVMWFGTWSGVSRYDGKSFVNFTRESGLAHDFIFDIYLASDGIIWFGTLGGGVSGYDGIAWTSLDTRDGLANNNVPSIGEGADGRLWFATRRGITRYRRSDTPPRAYIVSVTTDQTYRDLSTIPAFIPGTRVTIEYNSIDFKTIPEKRQYRCRIREMAPDWHKPIKSDTFDIILGEPGTYTFEVQAIDRDLNYSETASIQLKVIPDPRNHQIAQLKGELAERERAEMERMQQELEDARQIQQSLLPENPPETAGIEIAGTSIPAREVSGDFYSYLSLGDKTGIALADVTGKSVKAAMVAAMTSGMLNEAIKAQNDLWNSPSSILSELNTGLHPHLIRGMYTAMSLVVLIPEDKRLLVSNAGMPYPIVKRGKEVWELELNGMPLGLMDSTEYEDLDIDLENGDIVIFCSDGIIEATNEADEMYQTERLLELTRKADSSISAQEMVDLIVRDVTVFVGGEEPSDDITIVVLRHKE